jgi:hypothetical protein
MTRLDAPTQSGVRATQITLRKWKQLDRMAELFSGS